MPTFKDNLRQNYAYLNSFEDLDDTLRKQWIQRNKSILTKAKRSLTSDQYKRYVQDLYNVQTWKQLGNEGTGNFITDVSTANDFIQKRREERDFTLKYAPDTDELGNVIKNNTGWSVDHWYLYNKLDNQGKEAFKKKVKTNQEVQYDAHQLTAMQANINFGDGGLNEDEEKATYDSYVKKIAKENKETAERIWSDHLTRYRQSKEYQQGYDKTLAELTEKWKNERATDKKADDKHQVEFLKAAKENPLLAAASGTGANSNKVTDKTYNQYQKLMQDKDANFQQKYLAHKQYMEQLLVAGKITEDDYRKSLEDIAADALNEHEKWWVYHRNLFKGIYNQCLTYTMHKLAPLAYENLKVTWGSDGQVYQGSSSKIYSDNEIFNNAYFEDPNNLDEAYILKTPQGDIVSYGSNKKNIQKDKNDNFILKTAKGDVPLIKEYVAQTEVSGIDLYRLGLNDKGEENDSWFNEKYLSLSEKYNVSPWNKEELNYYDKYGYSQYNNIVKPGEDGRDIYAETIKMSGFVISDLIEAALFRGAGKIIGVAGKSLGAGMQFANKAMTVSEIVAGLHGALGIADSYAQGVFEENLFQNRQNVSNYFVTKAQELATEWATKNPEGINEVTKAFNTLLKYKEEELGHPASEEDTNNCYQQAVQYVQSQRAQDEYNQLINSEDAIQKYGEAIDTAGEAAVVDMVGEGLKYAFVNMAGYRSWMFKQGQSSMQKAALANSEKLFGKAGSKIGILENGKLYLKQAWNTMSNPEKAKKVLGIIGEQAWGGAWTNWTDEMQSAGAKRQNELVFNEYLQDGDPTGLDLFHNILVGQLKGISDSTFEKNSIYAGIVGGLGSVVGLGFNPIGIARPMLSKQGRAEWRNMSFGEKFNSIFSNSVLSEMYQQKAYDAQAQRAIDYANNLEEKFEGNASDIVNILTSAAKIGNGGNSVVAEENNIIHALNLLNLVKSFSKNNPGLAELDALPNIQRFQTEASKLMDINNLSEEEIDAFVDQIQVINPDLSRSEAEAELQTISNKATLLNNIIESWNELQNNPKYIKAQSENGEKTTIQENMENELKLTEINKYVKTQMQEREKKITSNAGDPFREAIFTDKEKAATYGNKKSAISTIEQSYDYLISTLEEQRELLNQKKEALNFDSQIENLKKQLEDTTSPTQKKNLQQQINDLLQDKAYYEYRLEDTNNRIALANQEKTNILKILEIEGPNQDRVFSAIEILNMDPITRMRMLDENNVDNYSQEQQKQIRIALKQLKKNGASMQDIIDQATSLVRYNSREELIDRLKDNQSITPSYSTRVNTMLEASEQIQHNNIQKNVKSAFKTFDKLNSEEIATELKKTLLKKYSIAGLNIIKEGLNDTDKALLEEIIPIKETERQLYDLITDSSFGIGNLLSEDKEIAKTEIQSIANSVQNAAMKSNNVEELIQNLAQEAVDRNSDTLSTLLDKLAQVYEQQHSTVVLNVKEAAKQKAKEAAETAAREQAAKEAIAKAENAPVAENKSQEIKPGLTIVENPTVDDLVSYYKQQLKTASKEDIDAITKALTIDTKKAYANYLRDFGTGVGKFRSLANKARLIRSKSAQVTPEMIEVVEKAKDLILNYNNTEEIITTENAVIDNTTTLESKETTVNTNTITSLDQATTVQEAIDFINASQSIVQPVNERDPHATSYIINGEEYNRVHGVLGDVWIGPEGLGKENKERSLKYGSLTDTIVRDFFNRETPVKPEGFTDEAFNQLITSLTEIKSKIEERGERFLTNNIVLYHTFPNGVKVAGEADIISVREEDGKLIYNIYDLKTSAGDKGTGDAFNKSKYWETNTEPDRLSVQGNREFYTNQVSIYKLLFEKMFGNKVKTLALLPYKLTYNEENNLSEIEKYPSIRINYNASVEKIIAYQPAINSALQRIQNTYKGIFSNDQLQALKGIITTGIISGEKFGKDLATWLNNSKLEDLINQSDAGSNAMNTIIKNLLQELKSINVDEVLKENTEAIIIAEEPAITTPEEIAVEEPSTDVYTPETEHIEEKSIDEKFGASGINNESQTPQVTAEDETLDTNLTTNQLETIDIEENEEVATVFKGNSMSPYVYNDTTNGVADADKQDAQRGILIRQAFGERKQQFYAWMESRGIHLQELIDNKLADILSIGSEDNPVKIQFLTVNPSNTSVHNEYMDGHYLLVVEDSAELRKVYTEEDAKKYGDFITANGKKYLMIGTAGFANTAQGNAYRNIFTKGKNSVKSKSEAYFKSNANEEFFVDQEKYTHVANIHSGFLTKQMEGDTTTQYRSLGELIADKDRNPHNMDWDNLVFGVQLMNDFKIVPGNDSTIYTAPAKAIQNIGNVFIFVPGANGKHTPAMIKPTRYTELKESALKNRIDNALRKLCSENHRERYNALLEMFDLVVLEQKDNNGIITGNDILIGTDTIPTLTFKKEGKEVFKAQLKDGINFQEVLQGFSRLNPRISITENKLLDISTLKELNDAGALNTDIAKLGKSSADYSVYNIDANGKPIITQEQPTTSNRMEINRGEVRKVRIGNIWYTKSGENFLDETGKTITDPKTLESIKINEQILNDKLVYGYTEDNNEYWLYYTSNTEIHAVYTRDANTHEAYEITNQEDIIVIVNKAIEERIKQAKEELNKTRDIAAEDALKENNNTKENDTKESSIPPVEDNLVPDVMYLLDSANSNNTQKPKSEEQNVPSTTVIGQDINTTERKSLAEIEASKNNTNFAGESTALNILQSDEFGMKAAEEIMNLWPETSEMDFDQIIDFLKKKNKQTESIKDINAWIDTLKC